MEDDCTTKPYGLEHVIAAVLYLSELDEITLQETKDYKRTHFMSDIGGGAGLILGIRSLPEYFRFMKKSTSVLVWLQFLVFLMLLLLLCVVR